MGSQLSISFFTNWTEWFWIVPSCIQSRDQKPETIHPSMTTRPALSPTPVCFAVPFHILINWLTCFSEILWACREFTTSCKYSFYCKHPVHPHLIIIITIINKYTMDYPYFDWLWMTDSSNNNTGSKMSWREAFTRHKSSKGIHLSFRPVFNSI